MMIKLIFAFLLVSAFPEQPSFKHLNASDGLSQNTVFSISQDADHNMWFATMDFINRYDGYHFKSYTINNPGITKYGPLPRRHLYTDKSGNIFYAAKGLYQYDKAEDCFKIVDTQKGKEFEDSVCCFFRYCDSILVSRGLGHIGIVNDRILSDDILWFATETNGLIAIEDSGKGNVHFWTIDSGTRAICSNQVRSICDDRKGHLWVGTGNGLSIIDVKDYSVVNLRHTKSHPESLSNNMIKDIFLDDAGGVWVASFYGGVDYYSPVSKEFRTVDIGLDENGEVCGDISEAEDGALWIGTGRNGVCRYEPDTGKYSWMSLFKNNPELNDVKSIVFSRDGKRVYVGTGLGGLTILDYYTRKVIYQSDNGFPKSVYSILEEDDRYLWIASMWGLYLFDTVSGEINSVDFSLGSTLNVFSLARNPKDGIIWVGAQNMLISCRLSIINSRPCLSEVKKYDKITRVQDILIKGNNIWAATRDGLYCLNGDKVSKISGLSSNFIHGLETDSDGNLWVGTDNGLCLISSENQRVSRFYTSDGLVTDNFSLYAHLASSSGVLYFGGVGGLSCFNPLSIGIDTLSHVPSLSTVVIDGNTLNNWDEGIRLNADQNVLDLKFSVPNYSSGKGNVFYYRMKGTSDSWNIAGPSAQVSYSSLKPGSYLFELKSENSSGIPCKNAYSLPVKVLPPWYQSTVAKLIYSVVFLIAIVWLIVFFIGRVTAAKDEEIAEIKIKSQEEINKLKVRQYSDIHLSMEDESFLLKVINVVEENLSDEEFSVEKLASELCMTRGNLHLKMKKLTGNSAIKFIQKVKFETACVLLKETKLSISEIGTKVGFSSPSYFVACFRQNIGTPPGKYREERT